MEKEQIVKALECLISVDYDREFCKPRGCVYSDCESCLESAIKDAIALIKQQDEQIFKLENRLKECENGYSQTLGIERAKIKALTEECENYKKVAECQQTISTDRFFDIKRLTEENERLRASSIDYRNIPYIKAEVIADTVREIFTEIYSSLDYIEEQMDPDEIPECFFLVREDIDALQVKFEGEGKDNG